MNAKKNKRKSAASQGERPVAPAKSGFVVVVVVSCFSRSSMRLCAFCRRSAMSEYPAKRMLTASSGVGAGAVARAALGVVGVVVVVGSGAGDDEDRAA
jgi:hypothetical protein